MLFGKAKLVSLVLVALLVSALAYGVLFTDVSRTLLGDDVFKMDLFKVKEVSLPEIQVAQINKRTRIPPLSNTLFGTSPNAEKPLTETRLNLQLKGTFPSSDQEQGKAIIVSGNKESLLHVGDEVLRAVTLVQVFNDYVVLDRANVREILRFPNHDAAKSILRSSQILGVATTDSSPNKRSEINRVLIEGYRKQFMQDPQKALSAIGVSLVGKQYQVAQESILAEAGFRPKDEIISINGQPIHALLNNPRMMKAMLSISSIRVGLMRGQQRQSLTYKLN